MSVFAERIINFFVVNMPSVKGLFLGGTPSLLWALACLSLAGYLKKYKSWKTGYTRKLFHFLIFGSVVFIQWQFGTAGVCLFGAMTSAVIGYAILKGSGHLLYEAMAREKDRPRQTYYIIAPYFATLLGGICGSVFFVHTVIFGYLTAGLGDAIAEPVGVRWGRHKYKTPSLRGVSSERSVEGSGAIFLVSIVAMTIYLRFSSEFSFSPWNLAMVLLIAVASTLAEAFSPHGWDNATMQIVPSGLGFLLFQG